MIQRAQSYKCPFCRKTVKVSDLILSDDIKFLKEIKEMTKSLKISKDICPIHQKKVEYYCKTCSEGACSLCLIEEKGGHNVATHNIEDMEARNKYLLLDKLIGVKNDIVRLSLLSNKIKHMIQRKKNQGNSSKQLSSEEKAKTDKDIKILKQAEENIKKKISLFTLGKVENYLKMDNISEKSKKDLIMEINTFNFYTIKNDNINYHLSFSEHYFTKSEVPITSMCLMDDNKLAVSYVDCKIRLMNMEIFSCEDLIITKHSSTINHISKLNNGDLISSSSDKTIKIFRIIKRENSCIATLLGHSGSVLKAEQISCGRICSCSEDKTLKIWNEEFQCIATLKAHSSVPNCFIELKISNCILSGSTFGELIVWSGNNFGYNRNIQHICCNSKNCMVETLEGKILIASDKQVFILGKNFDILDTISFSFKITCMARLDEEFFKIKNLAIGGDNGKIISFDFASKLTLEENNVSKSKIINDIIFYNGFLYYSCNYNTLNKINIPLEIVPC